MVTYNILGIDIWIPSLDDLYNFVVDPLRNFVNFVYQQLVKFFDPIAKQIKAIFDAIVLQGSEFFKAMENAIKSTLSEVFKTSEEFVEFLRAGVQAVIEAALKVGGAIYNLVYDTISSAMNDLLKLMNNISLSFIGVIQGTAGSLQQFFLDEALPLVQSLFNSINGVLLPVLESINEALTSSFHAIANIPSYITSAFDSILSQFSELKNILVEGLQGASQVVFSSFEQFAQFIIAGFQNIPAMFFETVKNVVIDPILQQLQSLVEGLQNFFLSFIDSILNLVQPSKDEILTDPIAVIRRVIGGMIGFGLSLGLPMLAAELVHPLKEMGFGQMAAYMWDLADFKTIGNSVLGTLIGISVGTPLRHALSYMYRPALPPPSTLDVMLMKRLISEEQWKEAYRLHGWEEKHIEAWLAGVWTEPSDRLILSVLETPGIPQSWVTDKLRARGYDERDVEILLMYGLRRRILDEVQKVRSALDSSFIAGIISEEEYAENLERLGLSEIEIAWSLHAVSLRYQRERTEEKVKILLTAFAKDEITEEDLRDGLSQLLVSAERVNDLVELAKFRKLPARRSRAAVQRSLTATQIVNAFVNGLLTEQQAREWLATLRYTQDAIDLMIAQAKLRLAQ
jgi:hypothetical protein